MTRRTRTVLKLLLALELAGIVWLVLNPSAGTPGGAVTRLSAFLAEAGAPFPVSDPRFSEYLLNVVLFVPLGFLCALLWERLETWVWVIAGFTLSLALESAQLAFLPNRTPTIVDLSSNTLGAFTGALFAIPVAVGVTRRTV